MENLYKSTLNRVMFIVSMVCTLVFFSSISGSYAIESNNTEITPRMRSIINAHEKNTMKWAMDPLIIEAVKEQNKKSMSLDEIKRIDRDWVEGKSETFIKSLQTNKAGMFLHDKIKTNKTLYVEAFLCDSQGAVVGEYPQTSDYWQGDEEKFTNCFNNGQGKVFINPLVFDESTNTYSVQISLPVIDQQQTIGVLIVGIKNI